ncbi:MAG: hypothetical protein WCT16_04950 [Candidatus Buchananbacteria bacterium]
MEKLKHYEVEPQNYEFFEYPGERQELFDYSKKIAEYLRTEKIPNLVIIDRSSRPLYIGVREYFRSQYPDEEMPNIYFMNPKGFKAVEDLTPEEIADIIRDCSWKNDVDEQPHQVRAHEDIILEFQDTYKRLMDDKEHPVLIFDTCIHSGGSLEPVKKIFDESGFSDVRIGAVNPSMVGSKVKTDFYITTQRPEKGCYPFDRDRIIEKTFSHVYSQRTTDQRKREQSIRLRKEIKQVMKEYLTKGN